MTVRTLSSAMHSEMLGGPAPDALAALIAMLATLGDLQALFLQRYAEATAS